MKLIVGLGNPGAKYASNRHNIGFMALDRIAADHGFAPWKGKHQGSISEGRFGSARAVLLKPETFMNNSGQSVQAALRFYKLEPQDVIVLHDEIDLAPGKVKCKTGGGHAGHNGLRSIHAHIGAEYDRVRLGVGHPGHKDAVPGFVLRDFPKADEAWLDDVLRGISDGAAHRVNPPRSGTGTKPNRPAMQPVQQQQEPAQQEPAQQELAAQEPAPSQEKSTLQILMEKFR
jgi:PTH1 family peptidyl-tRNA hydrolase